MARAYAPHVINAPVHAILISSTSGRFCHCRHWVAGQTTEAVDRTELLTCHILTVAVTIIAFEYTNVTTASI